MRTSYRCSFCGVLGHNRRRCIRFLSQAEPAAATAELETDARGVVDPDERVDDSRCAPAAVVGRCSTPTAAPADDERRPRPAWPKRRGPRSFDLLGEARAYVARGGGPVPAEVLRRARIEADQVRTIARANARTRPAAPEHDARVQPDR